MTKLSKRKIKWAIDQVVKHKRSTKSVAILYKVTQKNNPQTNGKLERWFEEYRKHRKRFETPEEFKNWYNKRIHGALNLEIGETPEEAFIRRLRSESLCGMFWKRIEK